jgi:3-oxoacyl-[acyl-carrier protein] reductase
MTVAVVTGGSTGIGAAICTHMLDAGYHVVALSRREPADPRCEHLEVDLLDPEATMQAAQDVAARHAITHVVHNAGAIRAKLLADVTIEDMRALGQLHLNCALVLTQAVLPTMRSDIISGGAWTGDAHRLFRNESRHDRHGSDLGVGACA